MDSLMTLVAVLVYVTLPWTTTLVLYGIARGIYALCTCRRHHTQTQEA